MLSATASLVRHRKIQELLDEYIEMYSSRDDLLTTRFSENFSGYTGSGDFLVKDLGEWIKITRQDFSQVQGRIRIEMLDTSLQDLSDDVVVATAFFHIHLPAENLTLAGEVARLVLIFRLENEDWKIVHSGISIPYRHTTQDGEVYPLKSLQEQNNALSALVEERTQALHKSEALYRQLAEDTLDVHWKTDSNMNITYISPSDENLRGYKFEEVVGHHVFEMFTDEGIAEVKKVIQQRAASQQPDSRFGFMSFEVEHRCKDGHLIWGEVFSKPDYDGHGAIIGYHGITREITKRKQIEVALARSETKFRTLFDTTADAVMMLDENGFFDCNPAALILFGFQSKQALCHYHPADLSPPMQPCGIDSLTLAKQHIDAAMKKGSVRFEWTHKRADTSATFIADILLSSMMIDGRLILQATVRDITKLKETEARVGFLANHDRLTELPNRALFYDRLSQAISQARRKNEYIAVLFLDLDGFKPINDTYGHEAGDVVLKVFAKRLQACVRNMDTVARIGGDEFAVILSALQHPSDAEVTAQKIIHHIAEVIQLNPTTTCVIGVSIGISSYPDSGTELDVLMNAADTAMYESKAAGKNTYTVSKVRNIYTSPRDLWIRLDEIPLLGINIIDEQHLKIASMLNELNDALKRTESMPQQLQLLENIVSSTEEHFKTEERLMREYGYPEQLGHQKAHVDLLDEINYLREQFTQGGELVLLQKLKDWFSGHIVNADKALADFIKKSSAK